MAELPAVGRLPLRSTLRRWRWLALYMLATLALHLLVPDRQALAPERELLWSEGEEGAPASVWQSSPGMAVRSAGGILTLAAVGPAVQRFARPLRVPDTAEAVALRFCLAGDVAADQVRVMMASVRGDALDFNRGYRVNSFRGGAAGNCFSEALSRRQGDGAAVLQLELQPGTEFSLRAMSAQPLRENPLWRWIRWLMLPLGLLLIAGVFWSYRRARPWWLCLSGNLVVAGIVFGCAVSVTLKADIFALLTGGRSVPVPQDAAGLLLSAFPEAEFSLFTGMHALLFACATILLLPLRREAWLDLALLALASENLQVFVPGRGPGLSDAMVDWQGILAALLLVFLFRGAQRVCALLQQQRIE